MNHRQVLDHAIRALPARSAAYMFRLADCLDRRGDLDDRRHLLYPVIAAAAPGLEPALAPEEVAGIAVDFLTREAEGIAAALYSPAFLASPTQTMAPSAARFRAAVAEAILDGLAAGTLRPPDDRVWRFHSDGGAGAFPYTDDEGSDDPNDRADLT